MVPLLKDVFLKWYQSYSFSRAVDVPELETVDKFEIGMLLCPCLRLLFCEAWDLLAGLGFRKLHVKSPVQQVLGTRRPHERVPLLENLVYRIQGHAFDRVRDAEHAAILGD